MSDEVQWRMIPCVSLFLTHIISFNPFAYASPLEVRTCISKSCLMTLLWTYLKVERERELRAWQQGGARCVLTHW